MIEEREQRWLELAAEIKCPSKPNQCRKNEGVNEDEKFLSNSAIIFTAECKFCGEKASGWGSR